MTTTPTGGASSSQSAGGGGGGATTATAAASASTTGGGGGASTSSTATTITANTTATAKSTKKKSKKSKASGETGSEQPKKKKARRKKTSSKGGSGGGGGGGVGGSGSGGALSAADIHENARLAQLELSQQRALTAARKSDPLWYSTQEALASVSSEHIIAPGILEDQVGLVETALSNNHLSRSDLTPQAFGCLLEQGRRYALELLADAQDYAYLANRQDVTKADLLMAVELRPGGGSGSSNNAATHTQHHKLVVVSHQVNRHALPPIPKHCYNGVVLPPKDHQVTSRTFDIVSGAQTASRMTSKLPQPNNKNNKDNNNNKSNKSATTTSTTSDKKSSTTKSSSSSSKSASYGVKKGPQIPIQLNKTSSSSASDPTTSAPTPAAAGGGQAPTT